MNKSFLLLSLLVSLSTACAVSDDELTETSAEQQLAELEAADAETSEEEPALPAGGTMQVGQTCRPGNVAPQPLVCRTGLICVPDAFGGYGRCALPPPPPPPVDEIQSDER